MAGKKRTHSEAWWETAPPYILRCNGHYKETGDQCRRVAEDGSVVCDQHGGAAAQVRKRAAERILSNADTAAIKLVEWMNDSSVDKRDRIKIAQDLLDRNGIVGAQVHKIMPITEDPIEALFKSILDDPNGLMDPTPPALPAGEDEDYGDLIGMVAERAETAPPQPEQVTAGPRLHQTTASRRADRRLRPSTSARDWSCCEGDPMPHEGLPVAGRPG